MSVRITREELLTLIEDDRELVAILLEERLLIENPEGYSAEDVDVVLCSRTLVRDFEVNLAGVEIILHLRQRLCEARRELLALDADRSFDDDE